MIDVREDEVRSMDIFMPIRFRTSVQLSPNELHQEFVSMIQKKLQQNLEGVCSRFGYIRPGSINIVRRSAGNFVKQHFNGHIRFDLLCKAEVCNPAQGMVLKAVVRNKNAMGLLAESFIEIEDKNIPVLDIIVPKRAAGIASEIDLDSVEIGDEIYVSVQGKRFQLNDKKISIIGRAIQDPATVVDYKVDMDTVNEDDPEMDGGSVLGDDVEDIFSDSSDEEQTEDVSDDEMDPKVKKIVTVDDEEKDEENEEPEDEDDFFDGDGDDADDDFIEDDDVVGGGGYDDFE